MALESAVGPPVPLGELVERIATRTASRTEADLQADLATLLRYGGLDLDDDSIVRREVPTADGTRRRIDIERGRTVFELKKDLRVGRERESRARAARRLRTDPQRPARATLRRRADRRRRLVPRVARFGRRAARREGGSRRAGRTGRTRADRLARGGARDPGRHQADSGRDRAATGRAQPRLQARAGQPAYVFAIPFPIFDPADGLHAEIALAAAEAERVAASVALPDSTGFQKARRLIRTALEATGAVERVEAPVARLLDRAPAN